MSADELKARKALHAGRVKRIKLCSSTSGDTSLFAVLSADRTRYYIVVAGYYCSCPDFLFSVVIRRTKERCYHMLAAEIVLKGEFHVEEECWSSEKLLKELLRSVGGNIGS